MKTKTLNILSGKGGSGKTIIALSISKFLSELQYKVLLVDCDIATHGATYFFEDEIDNGESKQVSIQNMHMALIKPIDIIKISKYFDFIPSTTDLKNLNKIDHKGFIPFYQSIMDNYDIIIFDNQAGYSNLLNLCVDLADKNLIVLETDTISTSALRSLYLKLGEKLTNKNTQLIFNKLAEEERDVYAKVIGGTLFPNLPPIPFDWKGRATFALGQIPSIEAKDSTFGLSILRIVKIIFKQFVEVITEYEKRTIGNWFDEITTNIDELEKKKKDISSNIVSKKNSLYKYRMNLISTSLISISILIILFMWINKLTTINLGIFDDIRMGGTQIIGTLIAALVGIAGFVLSYFSKLKYRQDKELEEKRAIVNSLDSDIKTYKTLIETDPQLREYYKMEIKKTISANSKKTLDKSYCVNKNAQDSGEHEVHTLDCEYIPESENRIYLGKFNTCHDAIYKAKEYYSNVDGCYYCSPECCTR